MGRRHDRPDTSNPAAGDTVTLGGGTGFVFQIVAGPGAAGTLTMVGNTAIEGAITAATAFFGTIPADEPSPVYTNAQAIDIEPASSVTVTDGAAIFNPFEIDGAGASLNVSNGLFDGLSGYFLGQQIVVVNFASLLADTATFYGGSLYVDPTAVAEIGSAGGAAAGVLTIDKGATLTTEASAAIDPNVTDNGLVLVADATSFDNSIGGTGTLYIEASTDGFLATVADTVDGLASIVVGAGSNLSVTNSVEAVNEIEVDSGSNLSVGDLSNDGPITDDGSLEVATDVTGSSTISVGTSGTLTIGGTLSGLSGISMGLNSVFGLSGQDTDVPIALGTRNNVLINLSEGSNIDGSVTGFDSSDLIASLPTLLETYITTNAVWSAGTLSLLSGGGSIMPSVVSTLALSGNYTGQQFLTNAVGISYGDTDIVLPNAFITTGIRAGAQTITGSTGKQFTLLTDQPPPSLTTTWNCQTTMCC